MATQNGLRVEKAGEPFKPASDIPRPSPGPGQALVKSLYVAINPVEPWMSATGMLVQEFPALLGSDFSGVVLETGEGCSKLKKGDQVYGLCRLGQNKYSPFQDAFLVDENLVFKNDDSLPLDASAAIGVAALTASFGVITGGPAALPEPGSKAAKRDDWIVILGGSGTVGHSAIQLASLCGYNIAVSCSPSKSSEVMKQGADKTFNNRAPADEQIAEIQSITGGHLKFVFDSSSVGHDIAFKALAASGESDKYFSSVDDVSEYDIPSDLTGYKVGAGHIGRFDEARGKAITEETAKLVPLLEGHIKNGALTTVDFDVHEGNGYEKLAEAIGLYAGGKAKKKLVVRVQE